MRRSIQHENEKRRRKPQPDKWYAEEKMMRLNVSQNGGECQLPCLCVSIIFSSGCTSYFPSFFSVGCWRTIDELCHSQDMSILELLADMDTGKQTCSSFKVVAVSQEAPWYFKFVIDPVETANNYLVEERFFFGTWADGHKGSRQTKDIKLVYVDSCGMLLSFGADSRIDFDSLPGSFMRIFAAKPLS